MNYKAKQYYQDSSVANRYYKKRFTSWFGKLSHLIEEKFLRNSIKDLALDSALDVACGTGRLTKILIDSKIKKVTGTDISDQMMNAAKIYCNNKGVFVKNDATSLDFSDEKFDLAISFRFLDHLPYEEKKKAISEMARVSKKYVMFTMANLNSITKFARFIRKINNRNYYEGSLVDEKSIFQVLKENDLKIIKRRLKMPFMAMEIMYFCEKMK